VNVLPALQIHFKKDDLRTKIERKQPVDFLARAGADQQSNRSGDRISPSKCVSSRVAGHSGNSNLSYLT
jgi:hypothetical protein